MTKNKRGTCARCHQPRKLASNGYCAPCNREIMAERRGVVPQPDTVEGVAIRGTVDDTFDYLDAHPGSTVITPSGVAIKDNGDDTVTLTGMNREMRRRAMKHAQI